MTDNQTTGSTAPPAADIPEAKPTYDVAISFLARDERIAAELSDLLGEGLNIFFFPRKQEELAGTDGLELMREPFLTARIVVVLYRDPWGQTPWTRVEQSAITERCLNNGWDSLLFVQLDEESTRPRWVPTTHIRFALEQYGIAQLGGAVKMRVQEHGGKIAPPDALSHARRVHREASRLADEKASFQDRVWIEENIHREVEWLVRRIAELTGEIRSKLGMTFVAVPGQRQCILRDHRVSVLVGWRQQIYATVTEEAELVATAFNAPIFLREERMMIFYRPTELNKTQFMPTLSLSRQLRWIEVGKKGEPLTTEEVAHRVLSLFLDLLSRADKGDIDLGHL